MASRFVSLVRLSIVLGLLVPSLAHAQLTSSLEIPGNGVTLSGIGVISGWKCEAEGDITIRLNAGESIPATYGLPRADTRGVCGNDGNNGFFSYTNWGNLGDGEHTAVAYDNGEEFARSTFTVATLGEAFVQGASGECTIPDFPSPGESATFAWNQSTQHLELVPEETPSGGGGGDGVCRVGLVVNPGESCTHPTNGETFSVDSSGRGRFMFFSAGTGINITNSSINGQTITFVARRNSGSNSWTIDEVG